jgi:hypothetical protein
MNQRPGRIHVLVVLEKVESAILAIWQLEGPDDESGLCGIYFRQKGIQQKKLRVGSKTPGFLRGKGSA